MDMMNVYDINQLNNLFLYLYDPVINGSWYYFYFNLKHFSGIICNILLYSKKLFGTPLKQT